MEVRGQPHSPVTVGLESKGPKPLNRGLGGSKDWSGIWSRDKSLATDEIGTCTAQIVDIRPHYVSEYVE